MARSPDPFDASDLSIVIPFRCDHPARLQNLQTVLRHLSATLAGAEIILLEDGPELVAGGLADDFELRYFGTLNDQGLHRTRLLNHGIETLSSRRFAASYDTDVLAFPDAWAKSMDLLRQGTPVVFPYDGRFIDLRGTARDKIIQTATLSDLPDQPWPSAPRWAIWRARDLECLNANSVGGVVLFDREVFRATGGYHEAFRAWGFEDAEIVTRMARLGHDYQRAGAWPLFHLAHPRGRRGGDWYGSSRQNRALYTKMTRLSRSEIENLVAQRALRV